MFDENTNFKKEWKLDNNNWVVGIALILLGGLFMLDTLNVMDINIHNWWAIFILIPGLRMVANGWQQYQQEQSLNSGNAALGGLFLIALSCIFFFNLSWSLFLPILLIGGGLYLLLFRR